MQPYKNITVTTDGPVTIVTIQRPERRNAINGETAAELAHAFRAFEDDDSAAVGILYGEGGNFCAGADLKEVNTDHGPRVEPYGDGPLGITRTTLRKPVIAAVEGYAVAGGLELAIWCSLRVGAEDSSFGVFCRRWGVPLVDGGTVRLPRLIGESRALDMILTGRPVEGPEALQFGLVNRLVPNGQALEQAIDLAKQISQFPQVCMRNDFRSVQYQSGRDFNDAMTFEFAVGMESLSQDGRAGADRFKDGAGRHGVFEFATS